MKRIDAKVHDMIKIGKHVSIKIEQKTGQIARLSIIAPPEIKIELVKAKDVFGQLDVGDIGIKAV
jgi:sRNA-binding carbon storage regulator CsrA